MVFGFLHHGSDRCSVFLELGNHPRNRLVNLAACDGSCIPWRSAIRSACGHRVCLHRRIIHRCHWNSGQDTLRPDSQPATRAVNLTANTASSRDLPYPSPGTGKSCSNEQKERSALPRSCHGNCPGQLSEVVP